MDNAIEIGDFMVKKSTMFWLLVLQENGWQDLRTSYDRDLHYISSYMNPNIKAGDIILVYQQHTTNKMAHGFVSVCQIRSDLEENKNKIKVFRDQNMNRYCSKLKVLHNFDNPYKILQMEPLIIKHCKNIKSATAFKTKYIKEPNSFIQIDKPVGIGLMKIMLELQDEIEALKSNDGSSRKSGKSNNTHESESEEEDDYDEDSDYESEEEDESDSDSEDIRVAVGHIPIIMCPCKNFNWTDDEFMTLKNFKNHFINCKKCDKTDNNNCSIYQNFDTYKFHCEELLDDDEIDEKLQNYYSCKRSTYELEGEDKKYDHIYVYKINSKEHIYHRALLIIW